MNLEDRIRQHYEVETTGTEPVDLTAVVARGRRLRRRAYAGTALFSVAGLAIVVLAAASFLGGETVLDGSPVAADESLQQQIDDSWKPVPDPVDPELVAVASDICPFDQRALVGPPATMTPVGSPELLVIDQRGVTATIVHGVKTTTGEASTSCGAVKVDGEWRRATEIDADWPSLGSGHGGIPEFVTEVRLRWPDGTEVTGSVGNGHYVIRYPDSLHDMLTEPNDYVYMDQYTDGTLVSTEFYMSLRDIEELRQLEQ